MTNTTTPDIPDVNEIFAPDGCAMRVIRYQAAWLVRLKVFPESEREDVEQELILRLVKRLQNYQPERSKLTTFIHNSVYFESWEILRIHSGDKHIRRRDTASLDVTVGTSKGESCSLGDLMTRSHQVRGSGRTLQDDHDQIDLRNDLEDVRATLPPELKELCDGLLEADDPATVLTTAKPRALRALRRRLKQAGLQDYL